MIFFEKILADIIFFVYLCTLNWYIPMKYTDIDTYLKMAHPASILRKRKK